MRRIFISFLLFFYFGTFAQKNYKIEHLKANFTILPKDEFIQGKLRYSIIPHKNTDSIIFDSNNLNIKRAKSGWFINNYYFNNNILVVKRHFKKGRTYIIKIDYTAKPKKAMYFVGWNSNGRKQVWTQGQGKNNSNWFPTDDDRNNKFTWDFKIKFDKNYKVISNGKKLETLDNKEFRIHHFIQDKPSASYLIFIGAGKYIKTSFVSDNGINVYNFQYSDRQINDRTYYKSKEIFNFVNKEIGVEFPWANYKQIPLRDFFYGGMENVSATSFNGNRYVVDSIGFMDTNFVNVQAHELVHQWFGDMMTGKHDKDHWLHEGFATYYAGLVDEYIFGKNYHKYKIYKDDKRIIEMSKSDTIAIHRNGASSLTYYQKGARVVEMLRNRVGDEKFKIIIKNFLNKYKFKNASIEDFKDEVFLVTNDSLNEFFKLNLETTIIPTLKLKQVNDSIVFDRNLQNISLPFLLIYPNKTKTVYASKNFKIPDYKNIKSVVANTDNVILSIIDFKRDSLWIKNQILFSPNFIDKFSALQQIKKWNEKTNIFNTLLNNDEYYPIYAEIFDQISNDKPKNYIETIKKLLHKDIETQKYIALHLNKIPKEIKNDYLNLLNLPSYSAKEAVLWKYSMSFPDEIDKILEMTKQYKGANDKSLRMTWLTLALLSKTYHPENKKTYYNEINNYTSNDYNLNVRLNSFYTLQNLNLFNSQSINNLIDACFHFNWHLHTRARKILKDIYPNYKHIIDELTLKLDSKKRKFIENLLK